MDLTIKEYAYWPTPEAPEYGLLFCTDENGGHWTARGDVDAVRMIAEASGETLAGAGVSPALFPHVRQGWPDEW